MPNEDFLALAIREFQRMKQLADRAISQTSHDAFFRQLSPSDNSIAILVKHVSGNLVSRWTDFLTSDGEKPERDRDAEFEHFPEDTREALLGRWEAAWSTLFSTLASIDVSQLAREVAIRGERLTVLQAITRQLTHYSSHVGQIVLLAKHFAGEDWKSLSIPKGQSACFNDDPKPYL